MRQGCFHLFFIGIYVGEMCLRLLLVGTLLGVFEEKVCMLTRTTYTFDHFNIHMSQAQ